MSRPVLAVFDDSPEYVNRFLGFLAKYKDFPFEIHGFTKLDPLEKYISTHEVGALVISMEDAVIKTQEEEKMLEQRLEDIISKTGERCIYLGERRNSECRLKHIDKYQAAADVVEEILTYCRERDWYQEAADRRGIRIIGIYLPVFAAGDEDRILQTAVMEAAKDRALFICLRRFTGLVKKLGIDCVTGLSDEIYYYKTNKSRLRETIKQDVRTFQNMDVLVCSGNMEDLDEIGDWFDFLTCLAGAGGYGSIVLDMGEAFRNLMEAFEMCDRIYIPWQGKSENDEYLTEFRKYFASMGMEAVLEKVSVIN